VRLGVGVAALATLVVGAALSLAAPAAQAQQATTFQVTITNQSNPEMIITPGAYLVHGNAGAFWTAGQTASLALERIAEIGDPGEAVASLGATATDPAPASGDSITFTISATPGQMLSTAQMLIATNDAFVGVSAMALFDAGAPVSVTVDLVAWDAGTEQNSALFAGFDGGQPDPSRGADNIENGTATSETIAVSGQFSGTQATLSVQPMGVVAPPAAGNAGIAGGGAGAPTALLLALAAAATLGATWAARRLVRSA
jgi:hypothetical protein